MRSSYLSAVAGSLILALTLSACGGSSSSEQSSANVQSQSSNNSDSAFPAVLETAFGEVKIESAPERIVALGWGDAETALALGVQPIGASDWLGFGNDEGVGPWAEGLYDTAPEIIATLEPSYEQIAALDPDLILDVRSSGDPERYKRLSEIATTVGIPNGAENYLTTMDQQVVMISTALGKESEGTDLLADVNQTFTDISTEHPNWDGKTVSVATRTSEGWGAYIEGDSRVESLKSLGFTQNPTIAALPVASSGFSVNLSSEELDKLDADLIVAFPIFIDSTEITEDAAWKQIPAVEEGHTVIIDGNLSNAFSIGSPLGTIYALKQMSPLITEALQD